MDWSQFGLVAWGGDGDGSWRLGEVPSLGKVLVRRDELESSHRVQLRAI